MSSEVKVETMRGFGLVCQIMPSFSLQRRSTCCVSKVNAYRVPSVASPLIFPITAWSCLQPRTAFATPVTNIHLLCGFFSLVIDGKIHVNFLIYLDFLGCGTVLQWLAYLLHLSFLSTWITGLGRMQRTYICKTLSESPDDLYLWSYWICCPSLLEFYSNEVFASNDGKWLETFFMRVVTSRDVFSCDFGPELVHFATNW